ncbi:MAG TPA: Na+/H+ antiporter NhaA [Oligoflexia bacterium]|nr:Na+/H+ antiporter NhaA [Oligoflexia bacterium]HMP47483.1 Na+/H+ antiporter NhaA [Oligoflexia bacterium]
MAGHDEVFWNEQSRSKTRIDVLMRPFRLFLGFEASGGILLILATLIALIWSNSPYANYYFELWDTKFTIGFAGKFIDKPLLIWINDGLMAVFFFVVGLEIKREFLVGDLSSPRRAALPIAGAIGGMILPAAIYYAFSAGTAAEGGWGVPMATDIAFALGILTLLGNRVPVGLKIFLAALAIVDDLGAVLVIAFWYTSSLSMGNLALGAFFFFSLIFCNYMGVRNTLVYGILGIGGLWLAFLLSGVHPTVAGVLAALCIPARTRIDTNQYLLDSAEALEYFAEAGESGESVLTNKARQAALFRQKQLSEEASSPLQRLEKILHPWAIYFVMPIFALSNAGVTITTSISEVFSYPSVPGIIVGLVVGKQVGVFGFSWIAVKLGIASLPQNSSWYGLYGVSCLAGIGFTMSLFIAGLAYSDAGLLAASKVAILIASLFMGILGYAVLKFGKARV